MIIAHRKRGFSHRKARRRGSCQDANIPSLQEQLFTFYLFPLRRACCRYLVACSSRRRGRKWKMSVSLGPLAGDLPTLRPRLARDRNLQIPGTLFITSPQGANKTLTSGGAWCPPGRRDRPTVRRVPSFDGTPGLHPRSWPGHQCRIRRALEAGNSSCRLRHAARERDEPPSPHTSGGEPRATLDGWCDAEFWPGCKPHNATASFLA